MFGVTLCLNEPCLKGRAYRRFGSFPGGQGSSRAEREPGAPEGGMLRREGCSGGMRPSPRPGPRGGGGVRGHKAGRDTAPQPSFGDTGRPASTALSSPRSLRARPAAPPPPAPAFPGPYGNFVPLGTPVPFCRDGGAHAWERGGQRRARFSRSLRKTGLATQAPGSKAGEAAAARQHLLLLPGPPCPFDPRA